MNVLALDLWQEVRREMRSDARGAAVDLWLRQSEPVEFARGVFTLGVPNDVVREWLDRRYRDDLESIFHRLTGSDVRVRVCVDRSLRRVAPSNEVASARPAARAPSPSTFVARPENRIAAAAVHKLLREPSSGNPLFLHGPSGSGKSRLVRYHIGRFLDESASPRTTVSITADAFSTALVRAIHDNQVSSFRGRMLAADVFVLEEAHRLRGKPRTQHEVQSVIQYHVQRGRPVILTSRHAPSAVFLLDEGLRSHFLSGQLLKIAEYSEASRAEILATIAEAFAHPMPRETIERIAHRVPGTFDRQVRFLEKVASFATTEGRPATLELIAERFPELAGSGSRDVDVGDLIALVAQEFGTTVDAIASNGKVRSVVLARHLVVYLATTVYDITARRVMRHLGGLSPSTTAYARRKIELKRKEDPTFDARVRRLMEQLDGGQKLLF